MAKMSVNQYVLPEEFTLPFGGTLNPENRWVKLAKVIPWHEFEEDYLKHFEPGPYGTPPFNVRVALGALIIQTKKNLTDRETVLDIQENPYYQYFIGFQSFNDKEPPFDDSMMTYFRKRLNSDLLNRVNVMTVERYESNNKDDDDPPVGGGGASEETPTDNTHQGNLILDATCAPADIHYPTDLHLLNDGRKELERLIDALHAQDIGKKRKPRTYRKAARNAYLSIEKKRKKTKKAIRKGLKKQLGYVMRDLKIIDTYLEAARYQEVLSARQISGLNVIKAMYSQQQYMYDNQTHQVSNRIVSLSQPHVRPIVRGKAGKEVEFGAKLITSVVNGYSFIEKMSFDNFNEGVYLEEMVKNYYTRYGYYPEKVIADTIFRNRKNIAHLKSLGIKMSGKMLGRPPKDKEKRALQKQEAKQDASIRIQIEGKYGVAKRRYGLDLIRAKTKETSLTQIALVNYVLNLDKIVRDFFVQFILWLTIRQYSVVGQE